MTRTLLTNAIALAAFVSTAPVDAAPVNDGMSVAVSYADLNFASSAGESVLKQRINAAISTICGHAEIADFGAIREVAKCRSDALASTRLQLAALDTKSLEIRVASR